MNGAARIAELQRRWRDADVQAACDELAGLLDELADEAASRDEEAGLSTSPRGPASAEPLA